MTGLFGSLFATEEAAPTLPADGDDFWYRGFGLRSTSGRVVTPETAMRVAAVFSCVNILAQTIAMLPLAVYRWEADGDKFPAPENPLYGLLHTRPNQWQTAYDFRAMMQGHLCLRGNAYAEILAGKRGAVDQLIPLHPDRVRVYRNVDRTLIYEVSELDGRTRKLVPDEMFHLRGLSSDGIVGMSPIQEMREAIGLALATEEHGSRLFSNGARPGGVIQMKGKLGPDARQNLREDWQEQQGGLGNAHRVAVLTEGMEFKAVGLSPSDSQFLEARKFQIEEIARIFRVPLFMLGMTEKSTTWGSGIEQLMIGFVTHTLMPWLVAWEQAISRDLIIAPDRFFARFDVNMLLRGDAAARAQWIQQTVGRPIQTVNEARATEGWNRVVDGDRLAEPKPSAPAAKPAKPADEE